MINIWAESSNEYGPSCLLINLGRGDVGPSWFWAELVLGRVVCNSRVYVRACVRACVCVCVYTNSHAYKTYMHAHYSC